MLSSISATSFATSSTGDLKSVTGSTTTASLTGTSAVPQTTEALPTDFSSMLGQMALDAFGTIKQGEATAVAGVRGQATTQQVVEGMMAAEQTLQAGIAIRDKVVSAYLEISRMSI